MIKFDHIGKKSIGSRRWFNDVKILHETEGAILINIIDDMKLWIPKSVCRIQPNGGKTVNVFLPDWFIPNIFNGKKGA